MTAPSDLRSADTEVSKPETSSPAAPTTLRCEEIDVRGQSAFLCVNKPKLWEPYLIGFPGVVVAIIGFIIVHCLSVRRQQRDEQFKMVQSARELIAAVASEAEEAWLSRRDRDSTGPVLIQRVGRVGRVVHQLKVRHKRLNVGSLVTGFRQAVTLDFEDGSPSPERRAEISIAAAELDEEIILQFLKKYG
jgi:hypothetical protein